jgi:hypothetical protein
MTTTEQKKPPEHAVPPPRAPLALRPLAPLLVPLALVLGLAAASCKREVDQAAKARIFSPEEPTGAKAEAGEKLDARRLGDDGALAARVLRMGREEAGHRLGAHKVQSKVTFIWTRGQPIQLADGGVTPAATVQAIEDSTLVQTAAGDFSLKLQNDHNQGFEFVWSDGSVYVRGLFGPFRKRRTDRTDPVRMRDQTLSALATFDRLSRGLKLRLVSEAKAGGRPALKYEVAGTGARMGPEDSRDLPSVEYPAPQAGQTGKALGPDADTARRLELFEKEQPIVASGTLVVDAETAAPLSADLVGRFRVTQKEGPAADLELRVALNTTDVGAALAVKTPAFEPDPSTPHAVKDPLRFLGKVAGPGAASTAEPVEDEEASPEEPVEVEPEPKGEGRTEAPAKSEAKPGATPAPTTAPPTGKRK